MAVASTPTRPLRLSAHAGLIAGLGAGSWGAAVALAMPYMGRLFDQKRWEEAFVMATLFPIAGLIVWWVGSRSGLPDGVRGTPGG